MGSIVGKTTRKRPSPVEIEPSVDKELILCINIFLHWWTYFSVEWPCCLHWYWGSVLHGIMTNGVYMQIHGQFVDILVHGYEYIYSEYIYIYIQWLYRPWWYMCEARSRLQRYGMTHCLLTCWVGLKQISLILVSSIKILIWGISWRFFFMLMTWWSPARIEMELIFWLFKGQCLWRPCHWLSGYVVWFN